jgi:hypothetical protein
MRILTRVPPSEPYRNGFTVISVFTECPIGGRHGIPERWPIRGIAAWCHERAGGAIVTRTILVQGLR